MATATVLVGLFAGCVSVPLAGRDEDRESKRFVLPVDKARIDVSRTGDRNRSPHRRSTWQSRKRRSLRRPYDCRRGDTAMAGRRGVITAILGIVEGDASKYCDAIRMRVAPAEWPANRDIAEALKQLGPEASDEQVAGRSTDIAKVRRAAGRRRSAPVINRLPTIHRRPTILERCSCGRPAIPGEGACYTCSS